MKKNQLKSKVVLLGLTGSIAIYKSCDLVRRLKEESAEVFCLMSPAAQKFVSPLTFHALSGNSVTTELWDEKIWRAAHLDLAEKADLYLVAPASADALAKLAQGTAEDILTCTALAVSCPVLIAPAMHEKMWLHPATQANVKKLKSYGYHFVGPERGPLSQGEEGWGRFSEPATILEAAKKILSKK